MIESVQVRQRAAYDFESQYDNLCALQDSCPIPAVKAHLSQGVLDINGDRVRSTDWVPVINTLRINKSLNFVAVRSYFQQPVDENGQMSKEKAFIWRRKTPAIRSKEVTYRLCKALRECLSITPALNCLELQGLPLRHRDLLTFAKGLVKNTTLHHLSLEYCRIGDDGLELICRAIKNSTTVTSINFSGCGLGWRGAEILSKIVRHQAMKRHNEAWRDSLRYRRPDLDRMSGIRRITVNCNPLMGDKGALLFAEALKDDLWLKALDLQQCGISDVGARALLDVLRFNTTVVVLDVRQNPLVDHGMLQSILEQVMINCNGQDTEFKWIRAEAPKDPVTKIKSFVKKRRTRTLDSSYGRKTTIKITPGANRKRSKTVGGVTRQIQPLGADVPARGIPWRTAMRAVRHRGFPPDHTPGRASAFERSEQSLGSSSTPSINETPEGPSIIIEEAGSNATNDETDLTGDGDERTHTPERVKHERMREARAIREMKIDLEQLRLRVAEESDARRHAEQKMLDLSVENNRLHIELSELKASKQQAMLEDESVLESIESSFKQFHAFLDMLRKAGFGELITLAGLDKKDTPFAQPVAPSSGATSFQMGDMGNRWKPTNQQFGAATDHRQPYMQGASHSTNVISRPAMSPTDHSGAMQQTYSVPSLSTTRVPHHSHGQPAHGYHAEPYIESKRPLNANLVPDNYANSRDPTIQLDDGARVQLSESKTDELYEKLVQETSHVLTQARSNSDHLVDSTAGRTQMTFTHSQAAHAPSRAPKPVPRQRLLSSTSLTSDTGVAKPAMQSQMDSGEPHYNIMDNSHDHAKTHDVSDEESVNVVSKASSKNSHKSKSSSRSSRRSKSSSKSSHKSLASSKSSYKSVTSHHASQQSVTPPSDKRAASPPPERQTSPLLERPSPTHDDYSEDSYASNVQPFDMLGGSLSLPSSPDKAEETSLKSEPVSINYEDSFEQSLSESGHGTGKVARTMTPEDIETDDEF